MKGFWYDLRMILAERMLIWLVRVAPGERDGMIIVKGARNIAEALLLSFEYQRKCGARK